MKTSQKPKTFFHFLILAFLTLSTPDSKAVNCSDYFQKLLTQTSLHPEHDQAKILVQQIIQNTKLKSAQNGLHFEEQIKLIDQISQRDPVFKKLVEMIDQKNFTFAIDSSKESRLEILRNGFKNQHQIESSNGVFNPEGRNIIEARYLRMEPSEYEKISASIKPKSMYLVPEKKSGINIHPTHYSMDIYAKSRIGDTWVLKLDSIQDNTVLTIGDSLDRAMIEGELVADLKWMTILPDKKLSDKLAVDYLIPLEWVKTSVPYYYQQVSKENKLRFVDPMNNKLWYQARKQKGEHIPTWLDMVQNSSRPKFDRKFFERFPELNKLESEQLFKPYGNYVEGLHFGELPPTKIKTLIYHSNPPSPEELKILNQLGIEVIDGRGKY